MQSKPSHTSTSASPSATKPRVRFPQKLLPASTSSLVEPGMLSHIDTAIMVHAQIENLDKKQLRQLSAEHKRLEAKGQELRSKGRIWSRIFRGRIYEWNLEVERLRLRAQTATHEAEKAALKAKVAEQGASSADKHANVTQQEAVSAEHHAGSAQSTNLSDDDKANIKSDSQIVTRVWLPVDTKVDNDSDQEALKDMLHRYLDLMKDEKGPKLLHQAQGEAAQATVDLIDACIFYAIQQREDLKHMRRSSILLVKELCKHNCIFPRSAAIKRETIRKISNVSLGKGATGAVYKGLCGSTLVALKEPRWNQVDVMELYKEAAVWRYLQHDNITPFYGICADAVSICLVSALMTNGTMLSYLKMNSSANRVDLLSGIVDGLVYMHELDLVHGDLKGDNILVNERGKACLADFGFSGFIRRAPGDSTMISSAKGGTDRYAAPEIQAMQAINGPTKESDIWSFAMVVWEMFTGVRPFHDIASPCEVYTQVYYNHRRPPRPKQAAGLGLSDELWELIERCWKLYPQDRPCIECVDNAMQGTRAEFGGRILEGPSEWPLKFD